MADKDKKLGSVSARKSGVSSEDRKKALETALGQIEKQFGKGAVMKLGQDSTLNVEAISTGSISRLVSEAYRAGVSSRYTGRKVPAKRRSRSMLWRRRRRKAARLYSSM